MPIFFWGGVGPGFKSIFKFAFRSQRAESAGRRQQGGSHSRSSRQWREIQKVQAVRSPLRPPRLQWTFNELSCTLDVLVYYLSAKPSCLMCPCRVNSYVWRRAEKSARSFLFEEPEKKKCIMSISVLSSTTKDCSDRVMRVLTSVKCVAVQHCKS